MRNKKVDNQGTNAEVEEEDTMATMVKPNNSIYEFNVKKESYSEVVERINEERLTFDFAQECFKVASQYKKPE